MNYRYHIEKVSLGCKVRRAIWNITYNLLFRPFSTFLFARWRCFLLRFFGAQIGSHVMVYASVKIWAPWNLVMHCNSCLGPHVICYNQASVTIGENSVVSQYSYLCNAGHDTSMMNTNDSGLIISPITIGKNVWIGTRAYIGMGVQIGDNAIVGATSSVFKDIPPACIVGGNPAQILKMRKMNTDEMV